MVLPAPMTPHTASRSVDAEGTVRGGTGEQWTVTLALAQQPSDRYARGTFSIRDRGQQPVATIRALGVLHTWQRWASVTAAAQLPGGEWRQVVAIVEEADPWRADRAASITLYGLDASGPADRARVTSR